MSLRRLPFECLVGVPPVATVGATRAMTNSRKLNAIVVGKFLPPHAGHHALIQHAESLAEHVIVVVVDGQEERPSADRRALWLQAIHPESDVIVAADLCKHGLDPCKVECSDRWAAWVRVALPETFDLVVSSETYGSTFANRLGAIHVSFDPGREEQPVSGTAVRTDLLQQWSYLHPIVRAGLHRRIVILGAESTGTTTLARDLAREIGAPIALEAGRTASWVLAARAGGWNNVVWSVAEFRRILADQRRCEADAANQGAHREPGRFGPWIVCDTDALATAAWWERYLDKSSQEAMNAASVDFADCYIVTDPSDVAFAQDGIRDSEHLRVTMHERFCDLVEASDRPWRIVAGSRDDRLAATLEFIKDFEETHSRFATTESAQ